MGIPVKQRWADNKMVFGRPTEKELSLEIIPRFRDFYEPLGGKRREHPSPAGRPAPGWALAIVLGRLTGREPP